MTINPETQSTIKFHIKAFVTAVMRSSADEEPPLTNCNSETARKIINIHQKEITREREQLSAIHNLWPAGLKFINKCNEFIISQEEFFDNLSRWGDFLRKNRPITSNNHKAMEENQKFLLKNRELAKRVDDRLIAANEILKIETGLDFGGDDNADIDTSPETLLKTKQYLDKVTKIINEYDKSLSEFHEFYNKSNSSPKLLQDEKWLSIGSLMIVYFWGVSRGIIPGQITPADIEAYIPGCQDVNGGLLNLQNLSQQLSEAFSYFSEGKVLVGVEKVAGILKEIIIVRKSLSSEIEKIISKL